MSPTREANKPEEVDPWTYLPGDDVLPDLFSGPVFLVIAGLLLVGYVVMPSLDKNKIFLSLQQEGLINIFFRFYKKTLWWLLLYMIPAIFTMGFAFYVEKTMFYARNREGLKEELTVQQLNKLFFIFLKRMSAIALIWPYSIYGYTYQFIFLKFFMKFFYDFMKA